eukprot:2681593-Pleurochrysis_carterae.AAC.1
MGHLTYALTIACKGRSESGGERDNRRWRGRGKRWTDVQGMYGLAHASTPTSARPPARRAHARILTRTHTLKRAGSVRGCASLRLLDGERGQVDREPRLHHDESGLDARALHLEASQRREEDLPTHTSDATSGK